MLTIYPHPADPKYVARPLLLCMEGVRADTAERIAAAGVAKEALHVAVAYEPPRGSFDDGRFVYALTFADGERIGPLWDLPLALPPVRAGVGHEPEVIASTVANIERGARMRVIGVHLEPRRQTFMGDGFSRNGVALLTCEGPSFKPYRAPRKREMPSGTRLIYVSGRIVGRASVEAGADKAARAAHLASPPHGWRLIDTAAGRFWTPRPAEDIAHRMRELRQEVEQIAAKVDQIARLDLTAEPDRARDLMEALSDLGRGAKADAIAVAAGIPALHVEKAPNRRVTAKAG